MATNPTETDHPRGSKGSANTESLFPSPQYDSDRGYMTHKDAQTEAEAISPREGDRLLSEEKQSQ